MQAADTSGPGRSGPWLLLLVVFVAALVPSLGTLDAGLISEDGAALGYVDRHGPLADLSGPQYDLRAFRFWRPLVTLSLDVQEATTGVAPAPLRLFNLSCHALSAMLLALLALVLGLPRAGALAAGVLAAWFPYQGGTVTWIVGRVDSLMVPLVLGCLLALVFERRWWAAVFCALALATKETAAVMPGLAVAVVVARRWSAGPERRAVGTLGLLVPTLVTFAVVFSLRAHWIGDWIGGYPGGFSGLLGAGSVFALVGAAVRAAVGSMGWLLLGCGLALIAALVARRDTGDRRPLAAVLVGLTCLVLALGPLISNLAPGQVAAEHQRTLFMADLFGCLAVGAGLGAAAQLGRAARLVAGLAVLALVGQRGQAAWVDTHDWARAGDEAAYLVDQVRLLVGGLVPSDLPVLVSAPPPTANGCYVLKFGVPDRFRAPFPATPRPVWPWGPTYKIPGQRREAVVEVVNHLRLPLDTGPTLVPELDVSWSGQGVRGDGGLHLSTALGDALAEIPFGPLPEVGPALQLPHERPLGSLEALVFTDQGYGVIAYGGSASTLDLDEPIPLAALFNHALDRRPPLADDELRLVDVLAWAADLGATEAYLELRLVDQDGEPLAASRWVPLSWDPELRDHLRPWDSF